MNASQPSAALTAQAEAKGAFSTLFLGLGAVARLLFPALITLADADTAARQAAAILDDGPGRGALAADTRSPGREPRWRSRTSSTVW